MNSTEDEVRIRCDCRCADFVVSRTMWEDGEVWYDISVMDSRYDTDPNSLWGRLKRALKALLGQPVYFNDVTMSDPAKFGELVDRLQALRVDDGR